uniref:Uncharacterized protein n=1 Tax=Panagrolaimus sp. ES5 TaxID=591445 RepID=A0AC34FWQ1_9BILA
MKLTVAILLCLIAVAAAGHHYGNNGGGRDVGRGPYGGGHGRDEESSSSGSSDEDDKPVRPKKCATFCSKEPEFKAFYDRQMKPQKCGFADKATADAKCPRCCDLWGLSKGFTKDSVVSQVDSDNKCNCCESKCI